MVTAKKKSREGKEQTNRGVSDEQRAVLRRNRLLSELRNTEMDDLFSIAYLQKFSARQVIFQKGDPGSCLYAILSGKVGITTTSEQGREVFLNVLESGDVLGEIALLDGKDRTANAIALEETRFLVIERKDFLPFLEQRPVLCIRLMSVLCERLRWTSMMIEDTIFLDVQHRLAKRLQSLVSQFGRAYDLGVEIDLKLSQEDLANMLGTTRESVNKGLRMLEMRGIIAYRRGTITVVNAAELARFVREGETG